jgi:hypothetical protein
MVLLLIKIYTSFHIRFLKAFGTFASNEGIIINKYFLQRIANSKQPSEKVKCTRATCVENRILHIIIIIIILLYYVVFTINDDEMLLH